MRPPMRKREKGGNATEARPLVHGEESQQYTRSGKNRSEGKTYPKGGGRGGTRSSVSL